MLETTHHLPLSASTYHASGEIHERRKVDVRVNVTVDAASVVLLIATTTMAYLFYKQDKQDRQDRLASSKI